MEKDVRSRSGKLWPIIGFWLLSCALTAPLLASQVYQWQGPPGTTGFIEISDNAYARGYIDGPAMPSELLAFSFESPNAIYGLSTALSSLQYLGLSTTRSQIETLATPMGIPNTAPKTPGFHTLYGPNAGELAETVTINPPERLEGIYNGTWALVPEPGPAELIVLTSAGFSGWLWLRRRRKA